MPDTLFLQIFDMTKIASIVILIVLLVRLCLKRAPKVFSYALWAVVLFRLLCPISIEAPISLIPQTEPTIESYDLLNEPVTPLAAIDAAQRAVGDVLNGGIGIQHVRTTEFEEDGTRRIISTDWWHVLILFGKYVWLAGIAVMLIYSGVAYAKLRRKLLASINIRDNIYIADHIDSPFVMGLLHPKIYLPSSLSEKERGYIILHEQHHIRRGDHIVKLLSFAALCLHWFNPLVWAAFILSGKDMEMSCDEAVLRKLGGEIRADYSASLISLATGRRIIADTPLAFGEGNTEGRIKNIAKWKKPAVWVSVIAVIVCVVAVVCLITNPAEDSTEELIIDSHDWTFTTLLTDNGAVAYCSADRSDVYKNTSVADITLTPAEKPMEYLLSGDIAGLEDAVYRFDVTKTNRDGTICKITSAESGGEVGHAVVGKTKYHDGSYEFTLIMVLYEQNYTIYFTDAPELRSYSTDIKNMTPTTANVTGAFDSYLYVPIDGANYRYELIFDDPASVTKDKLIHTFTEEADPENVDWCVYSTTEYHDRSIVLAEAGEDYVHLYRYSPAKAVDPALLEQAKEGGKIVLEDGYATSGEAVWNTFYKLSGQGKHISADIVHYHTLREPQQYDEKYYEAHKEDYPALYEFELTHDGGTYTMKWNENGTEYVRTYKYLRVFEDTVPSYQSSKEPEKVTRYVMTNDNTATLDELWRGVASSQLGDYIDFYTIYSVKN